MKSRMLTLAMTFLCRLHDLVVIAAISFESSKRSEDTETEGTAAACLSQHTQPLNVPKGVRNQAETEEIYFTRKTPNLS